MPKKIKRKDALNPKEKKLLEKPIEEKLKENPNADITELTKVLLKEHDIPEGKLDSARGVVAITKRQMVKKGVIEVQEEVEGEGEEEGDEEDEGEKPEKAGGKKKKKKKKNPADPNSDDDPVELPLQAFQLFQTGADFTDVMADLHIDDKKAMDLRQRYNRLRDEQLKGEGMEERYLQGTFMLAKTMGEDIRNACPHFNDESGCCDYWSFRDVDTKLRKKYPGMFKTVGNTIRPFVLNHPQLCCLCDFAKERRPA